MHDIKHNIHSVSTHRKQIQLCNVEKRLSESLAPKRLATGDRRSRTPQITGIKFQKFLQHNLRKLLEELDAYVLFLILKSVKARKEINTI